MTERFTPWTGPLPQQQPQQVAMQRAAPASTGPRFTPWTGPAPAGSGGGGMNGGGGMTTAGAFGTALGGLKGGLGALGVANQAFDQPFGSDVGRFLNSSSSGLTGLKGLFDLYGGIQGLRQGGNPVGSALQLGSGALGAYSAASNLGLLGEAGTGALGSIGSAIPYVGAALGVAQGGLGFSQASSDYQKALSSLQIVGAAAAPFTFGASAALPLIAQYNPILGPLFKGLFEGGPIPHDVREAKEVARHAQQTQGFTGQIAGAKTFDELYQSLLSHQTGYVGGTAPQATNIGFRASEFGPAWSYLGLYGGVGSNAAANRAAIEAGGGTVPTPEEFFARVRQDPGSLFAGVQAGVAPGKLTPLNASVQNVLQAKVRELDFRAAAAPVLATLNQGRPGAEPYTFEQLTEAASLAQTQGLSVESPAFLAVLAEVQQRQQAAAARVKQDQVAQTPLADAGLIGDLAGGGGGGGGDGGP